MGWVVDFSTEGGTSYLAICSMYSWSPICASGEEVYRMSRWLDNDMGGA